jgi:hypothetical protein
MVAELNTQPASIMVGHYRDRVHLRASAEGRVFGLWCTSHSPSGMGVIVYSKDVVRTTYAHRSVGHVVPSPDGKVLYTNSGKYVLQSQGRLPERPEASGLMLPASLGDQVLHLAAAGEVRTPTIETPGKEKPLATLPDLGLPTAEEKAITHDLTFDKRVHLVPEARLLITIPASGDRLVLYPYGS